MKTISVDSGSAVVDKSNRIPTWLGVMVILIWLVGTAIAFWFTQFQYLQPFQSSLKVSGAYFKGLGLDLSAFNESESKGTVLHFWDPGCPCTRFSTPHVKDLIAESSTSGINNKVLLRGSPDKTVNERLAAARKEFGPYVLVQTLPLDSPLNDVIPASPSAIVINPLGEMTYLGPYSSDAFCSTDNGGFVEIAMRELAHNRTEPLIQDNYTLACFCNWQQS